MSSDVLLAIGFLLVGLAGLGIGYVVGARHYDRD